MERVIDCPCGKDKDSCFEEIQENLAASFVIDGGITASKEKFRVSMEMIDIEKDEVIRPVLTDGQKATLANLKATQNDWVNLRNRRNLRLRNTDEWALSDRTMSTAQKEYRQALRDLPANTSDPTDITWPTKPT